MVTRTSNSYYSFLCRDEGNVDFDGEEASSFVTTQRSWQHSSFANAHTTVFRSSDRNRYEVNIRAPVCTPSAHSSAYWYSTLVAFWPIQYNLGILHVQPANSNRPVCEKWNTCAWVPLIFWKLNVHTAYAAMYAKGAFKVRLDVRSYTETELSSMPPLLQQCLYSQNLCHLLSISVRWKTVWSSTLLHYTSPCIFLI
jgi:hypothetical protein